MYTGECKYWVWLRRTRWRPDQKDRANHSNVTVSPHCWVWGTGSKKPAEAGPVCEFTSGPLSWVGWWKNGYGICTILSEDMLSHLKNSHQRESKLGLETAESRYGSRQHKTSRFTQKLNDKPYLFSFILEGISSVPPCQDIREHTIFYVIWNNIKILAIYILTFC